MPICKKCSKTFPNIINVDGKKKYLNRRSYCLECSPLGQRTFYNGEKIEKSANGKRIKKKRKFICKSCGEEREYKTRDLKCSTCRSKEVRRRNKKKALELFESKCCKCGYDKCFSALEFHHKDEEKKEVNLSTIWLSSWKKIEKELQKCILVCANCHRELHEGLIEEEEIMP